MNLKTFRGDNMAQALAEVKKDLGKDAVILHTRTYRVGAVLGLGGRNIVEITASDQAAARDAQRLARRAASGAPAAVALREPPASRRSGGHAADSFTPTAFTPVRMRSGEVGASPSAALKEERRVAGPSAAPRALPVPDRPQAATEASNPPETRSQTPQPVAPPARAISTVARLAPVNDTAIAALHDELASIRRLVGQVLQCSRSAAVQGASKPALGTVLALGGMSDPLFAGYMRLCDSGASAELAESVAGKVRDELSPTELVDPSAVEFSMLRHLASRFKVCGEMTRGGLQSDGRPLTIALVGPTGVGKTTTIAKLAAAYKLRQGQRVGLVTSDTYRIAAVDQLRTYANIIGLPLKVATTPQEVGAMVGSLTDCDVILLDTAGRSQHDASRLTELARVVQAARPHETHLVLSTAVSDAVLKRTCERFASLAPNRVIFSKVDEAVATGCLVNIAGVTHLPISYLTTGQEVPDQIELARADRLARLVLLGPASEKPA